MIGPQRPAARAPRRWRPSVASGVVAVALAVSGCAPAAGAAARHRSDRDAAGTRSGLHLHGLVPDRRLPRPDFRLTETTGRPFDFGTRTAGRVTMLYFGYTHCPDVCPTTMADVAAALRDLPADVRNGVSVVFVTTDPQRDTGPVLRAWLDSFDPSFVGLTGSESEITAAEDAAGVPNSSPEPVASGSSGDGHAASGPDAASAAGNYAVGHAATLITYGRDDRTSVVYLMGTTSADYRADLPSLVQEEPSR